MAYPGSGCVAVEGGGADRTESLEGPTAPTVLVRVVVWVKRPTYQGILPHNLKGNLNAELFIGGKILSCDEESGRWRRG